MPRKWEPRELRLLSEYLMERYPTAIHLVRVRLGTLEPEGEHGPLTPEELRALGVLRRWADAIVVTKTEMILIEAAIRPDTGEASKLKVYADLVPLTPELEPYRDLPLRLELVYAVHDPVVIRYCEREGIRCVHFCPDWVLDYLRELAERKRIAPAPKGLVPPEGEKK